MVACGSEVSLWFVSAKVDKNGGASARRPVETRVSRQFAVKNLTGHLRFG